MSRITNSPNLHQIPDINVWGTFSFSMYSEFSVYSVVIKCLRGTTLPILYLYTYLSSF